MGCIVSGLSAKRAVSVGHNACLCAIGLGDFEGTPCCPELVDTNLKDLADGSVGTGRGVPHIVTGGREGGGSEGTNSCICV